MVFERLYLLISVQYGNAKNSTNGKMRKLRQLAISRYNQVDIGMIKHNERITQMAYLIENSENSQ